MRALVFCYALGLFLTLGTSPAEARHHRHYKHHASHRERHREAFAKLPPNSPTAEEEVPAEFSPKMRIDDFFNTLAMATEADTLLDVAMKEQSDKLLGAQALITAPIIAPVTKFEPQPKKVEHLSGYAFLLLGSLMVLFSAIYVGQGLRNDQINFTFGRKQYG